MSPASRALLPRFVLREVADINRLFVHLLTHWRLPRVEFRIDGLHVLHSQHAQDRFVRLSDACNCLLGEALAVLTLLVGSYATWTTWGGWPEMGWVVLATLGIGVVGKVIEAGWTRLKLLRVLRDLRRRLGTADGSPEREFAIPAVAPHVGRVMHAAVQNRRVRQSVPAAKPRRPKVVLRDIADIDRLFIHLVTHWRLPRIDIHVDSIPGLEVQRAQASVVRFSDGCSYMPAAFLSAAILLGGLLYIIWTESQAWFRSERADWWLLKLDWDDALPVVLAALAAALVGTALEWAWMRVRLLLVLRGLRDQVS